MRIYLAGSSKQRPFIAYLARQIEQQGHEITHKWWVDYNDDMETFGQAARADLEGIAEASVLVAILDHMEISPGAHLEMGYALALQIPILAIVSDFRTWTRNSIWLHLPGVVVVDQAELAVDLYNLQKRLQQARWEART